MRTLMGSMHFMGNLVRSADAGAGAGTVPPPAAPPPPAPTLPGASKLAAPPAAAAAPAKADPHAGH